MSVGMVIMRPTSIVVAGGGSETASIRAAGGVEFSAATSLSLNGVFTADFDDYMIVIRHKATADDNILMRLRTSGSDANAANYTRQYLFANDTSVTAARQTSQTGATVGRAGLGSGDTIYVYGPNLAQPTAFRNVNVHGRNDGVIRIETDNACTHSLSTSYDGCTLYSLNAEALTGLVTVYGLAQ